MVCGIHVKITPDNSRAVQSSPPCFSRHVYNCCHSVGARDRCQARQRPDPEGANTATHKLDSSSLPIPIVAATNEIIDEFILHSSWLKYLFQSRQREFPFKSRLRQSPATTWGYLASLKKTSISRSPRRNPSV